jgi:hypothetical protein
VFAKKKWEAKGGNRQKFLKAVKLKQTYKKIIQIGIL